jgi:hypothetical protein
MVRLRSVLLFSVLLPPPLAAQSPPQSAPMAANGPVRDPDAIQCRRIEPTGSRIPSKRICRTNAQWDRMAQQGNETARAIVDKTIGIGNELP